MFKLTGTVKVIKETVQVNDKFSKREFVINDASSMYPQDIMFQSVQDKVSIMDSYKVGDTVEVSFNLRGREWTSPQGEVKYFNTLEAWRCEGATLTPLSPELTATATEDDDLPF